MKSQKASSTSESFVEKMKKDCLARRAEIAREIKACEAIEAENAKKLAGLRSEDSELLAYLGMQKATTSVATPKKAAGNAKVTKTGKIDGRSKEARAAKAAAAAKGSKAPAAAKKTPAKVPAGVKVTKTGKIDGRSKEARAAKAAAAAKGSKKAPAAKKAAKKAPAAKPEGKIDGRSKEARAAKAAAAAANAKVTKTGKIDGRSKEARAAKAAAAGKAPAAAKKTPAKKAAKTPAKKAASSKGDTNVSNATEGRRAVAQGKRPPMKEAVATVIGKTTMTAAEVVTGLEKKDWLPNTNKVQQYVSYILSSNKDIFERVEHGKYKVQDGVTFAKKTPAKKVAASPTPKKTNGAKSRDQDLEDLGIDTSSGVAANPFDGEPATT